MKKAHAGKNILRGRQWTRCHLTMDSTRKVHNFFSSNKEAHDKGCGPNSHCFEFIEPNSLY